MKIIFIFFSFPPNATEKKNPRRQKKTYNTKDKIIFFCFSATVDVVERWNTLINNFM
jgi:hypothetical protein